MNTFESYYQSLRHIPDYKNGPRAQIQARISKLICHWAKIQLQSKSHTDMRKLRQRFSWLGFITAGSKQGAVCFCALPGSYHLSLLSSQVPFYLRKEALHVPSHQLSHGSKNTQLGMFSGAEHLLKKLMASPGSRACPALSSDTYSLLSLLPV